MGFPPQLEAGVVVATGAVGALGAVTALALTVTTGAVLLPAVVVDVVEAACGASEWTALSPS